MHLMGEDSDNGFIAVQNAWPDPEGYPAFFVVNQIRPGDNSPFRFVHARTSCGNVGPGISDLVDTKMHVLRNLDTVPYRNCYRFLDGPRRPVRVGPPAHPGRLPCDHAV